MRSVANFRRIQNRVQAGAVQPVPQWHSNEERQRLIQMQLEEANAMNITPNHQALVNQILATREADALNHEAEATEALADFSKLNKIQRKLEMQLLSLRSKNAHIKGYRAVIVGNRIVEKIGGMTL